MFKNLSFFIHSNEHLEKNQNLILDCIKHLPSDQVQSFSWHSIDTIRSHNIPILPIKLAKFCNGTFFVDDIATYTAICDYTNYTKIVFNIDSLFWYNVHHVTYKEWIELLTKPRTIYITSHEDIYTIMKNCWNIQTHKINGEISYEKISEIIF